MKKYPDLETVYFDVDDTLIMWNIADKEDQAILIDDHPYPVLVVPHEKHIRLLKKHKRENCIIVVWSQGGSDWAERVVKALKLEDYVDVVITKPTKYYDDLDMSSWAPPRSYLEP